MCRRLSSCCGSDVAEMPGVYAEGVHCGSFWDKCNLFVQDGPMKIIQQARSKDGEEASWQAAFPYIHLFFEDRFALVTVY